MKVSEIRAMDKEAKIASFTGRIVEMKKPEDKDYGGKKWKEQSLKVEDADGKKIKVVLNNSAVGLEAQDILYTFKECVVNKYDSVIDGKNVTCVYLKAWKGCEVSSGAETEEKPAKTQGNAVSGHSGDGVGVPKTPYYNTSESIARMNALGHAVELIKLKGTQNPLIDIVEIATPLTKWILTGAMYEESPVESGDVREQTAQIKAEEKTNDDIPF